MGSFPVIISRASNAQEPRNSAYNVSVSWQGRFHRIHSPDTKKDDDDRYIPMRHRVPSGGIILQFAGKTEERDNDAAMSVMAGNVTQKSECIL